jgi:hypothetical protein
MPPRPKKALDTALLVYFGGGAAIAAAGLIAVLVLFVFKTTVEPLVSDDRDPLELTRVGDLSLALRDIASNEGRREALMHPDVINKQGASFWVAAIHTNALDANLNAKLLSPLSNDGYKPPTIPVASVSYTAPKAGALLLVMARQDSFVLITWNSRNWRNAGGDRVPVVFNGQETASWLTFEDAQRGYGINRAEWDDPAGQLFGKKTPFQFTYE